MPTEHHDCSTFQNLLSAAVAADSELLVDEVRKAQHCDRCREIMNSIAVALNQDVQSYAPGLELDRRTQLAAGRMAIHAWRIDSGIRISIGLLLGALVFFVWEWSAIVYPWLEFSAPSGESMALESAKAIMPTLLTGWLFYLGTINRERNSKPGRLYCRWQGRQMQGICVGLSEYFAIPVWIPRLVFLVLMLFDLGGLAIYVAATLGLTFHPDDREHMLRFRIQRIFHRRRGQAVF